MPDDPRIVVVGGGITGLACALRLQNLAAIHNSPPARVTLLEAEHRLGGKLLSHHIQGFVVDAGADIFLASKPGALELCSALGIAHRVIHTDPARRRTFVRIGTTLRPATHYGAERLATMKGGMQELVDHAARALHGVKTITASTVEAIQPGHGCARYHVHTTGGTITADAVVIAVPARPAAAMLRPLAPKAAAALDGVSYRSSFTVSAGYRADDVPHPLDGYGYLVPDAGAGEVSACTWTSSKIPARAPASHVLLRGYVHGAADLTITDARQLVLDEFRQVLGISSAPLFSREHAWHDALPVTLDNPPAVARAARSALAEFPGIFIAGGALDGVGIPDSIESGQSAAELVWHHIVTSRPMEAGIQ